MVLTRVGYKQRGLVPMTDDIAAVIKKHNQCKIMDFFGQNLNVSSAMGPLDLMVLDGTECLDWSLGPQCLMKLSTGDTMRAGEYSLAVELEHADPSIVNLQQGGSPAQPQVCGGSVSVTPPCPAEILCATCSSSSAQPSPIYKGPHHEEMDSNTVVKLLYSQLDLIKSLFIKWTEDLSLIKNLLAECMGQLLLLTAPMSSCSKDATLIQPLCTTLSTAVSETKSRVDRDPSPIHELSFTTELPTSLYLSYLTITGNVTQIKLVLTNHHLQLPMYFFLSNLSFLELMITATVMPKMLINIITGKKTISFVGCPTQSFFYFLMGSTEFFILAVMSFDHYVAICYPLRYASIMNSKACFQLLLGSWVGGFLIILVPSIVTAGLPFCGPNIVNHFFCDSAPLLKLVCGDTSLAERVDFGTSSILLLGSLLITVVSYIYIIIAVLKIPSAQGRQKAFSTYVSHITVVILYYGSSIFIYVHPTKGNILDFNKIGTVLNTMVTPMLNPFIYSLRNVKVKDSLRVIFNQRKLILKK
ncbi:olfactory receptor 6M1-like [Rhineura floridana]|uniref:olfactory receptor 6M1-like n=1 Tax=Rhineura floridana TaxID=261503 RepID=UPI002AC8809F|nr:olfactory receptor 6M1-like [Rhineura floridana]